MSRLHQDEYQHWHHDRRRRLVPGQKHSVIQATRSTPSRDLLVIPVHPCRVATLYGVLPAVYRPPAQPVDFEPVTRQGFPISLRGSSAPFLAVVWGSAGLPPRPTSTLHLLSSPTRPLPLNTPPTPSLDDHDHRPLKARPPVAVTLYPTSPSVFHEHIATRRKEAKQWGGKS